MNVALRQTLDLYVCLRPVRYFNGVVSPVKHPEYVDMVIFRENTEDINAGIEWEAGSDEASRFYKFLHDEMGVEIQRRPILRLRKFLKSCRKLHPKDSPLNPAEPPGDGFCRLFGIFPE